MVKDYRIDEQNGEKVIYHLGNYYPCDVGIEYIMFLGEYCDCAGFEAKYYAVGCEYGRYPVFGRLIFF